MLKKLLKSYYSRILLVFYLIILVLTVTVTMLIITIMNKNQLASDINKYNKSLYEISSLYDEITTDIYYRLVPFFAPLNGKKVKQFCEGDYSVLEQKVIENNFESVLAEVSQRDARIKGIYFKRLSDDSNYLYLISDRKLKKTEVQLIATESGKKNYSLIGARELTVSDEISDKTDRTESVFGIQMRPMSLVGITEKPDFQVVLLYGTEIYDEVLSKYNIDSKIRFFLLTQKGVVLYDNWGEYAVDKETSLESMNSISGEFNNIEKKWTSKGYVAAQYVIPMSVSSQLQMNAKMKTVIIIAIGINIVFLAIIFTLRQVFSRKFKILKQSLEQIGMNNLEYRMPVSKNEDEFSMIAINFNKMCDDLQSIIDKYYVYVVLQQKAEYQQLKNFMNPHFLYNSLEAIRKILVKNEQEDSADAILQLSSILDYQLCGNDIMPVWNEQNVLCSYLELLSFRYQDMFEYNVEFNVKILDYMIPKFILLTIMDVYIQYCFKGDNTDYMYIKGYIDPEDEMIHIDFCNNGKEIQETYEELQEIDRQIKIAYGGRSRIEVVPNKLTDGGCISVVFEKNLMLGSIEK